MPAHRSTHAQRSRSLVASSCVPLSSREALRALTGDSGAVRWSQVGPEPPAEPRRTLTSPPLDRPPARDGGLSASRPRQNEAGPRSKRVQPGPWRPRRRSELPRHQHGTDLRGRERLPTLVMGASYASPPRHGRGALPHPEIDPRKVARQGCARCARRRLVRPAPLTAAWCAETAGALMSDHDRPTAKAQVPMARGRRSRQRGPARSPASPSGGGALTLTRPGSPQAAPASPPPWSCPRRSKAPRP